MDEKYWGYHLLINGHNGRLDLISNKENVSKFVDDLVEKIDMVKYGPLWIERFATHDPDKAGISFCQMIETSNITGHFAENTGDFYIDIFSCKPYSREDAEEIVRQFFQPDELKSIMINRDPNIFKINT